MSELRRMRPLLGTFVEIGIVDSDSPRLANEAINRAFSVIELVQNLLSFQNRDSELSRLNRSSVALTLHPFSVLALRLARGITRASNHLFNCTVAGRMIDAGILPNHTNKFPLLSGNADDIAIRGHDVKLLRPVQITLDGIAKGLAVDLASRSLRAGNITSGWINAGGDLLAFGKGIIPVHRRELNGLLTPLGLLHNGAIASSAVNVICNAHFPGLIVSDRNIKPEIGVWSVRSAMAWRADALTKVAALAGSAERLPLIKKLGGQLLNPARVNVP